MAHAAINIFGFLFILIMGWCVFILWLVGQVFRAIGWGLSSLFNGGRRRVVSRIELRRCSRLRCRAQNPAEANFCRRCGATLAQRTRRARLSTKYPLSILADDAR